MKQKKNGVLYAKRTLITLLVSCLILSFPVVGNGASAIPDTIKVGLFYNKTALSTFNVKSDGGLSFGYCNGSKFFPLFTDSSNNMLTVRQDQYLDNDPSLLSAYGFGASGGSSYYHIQIGDKFDSLEDASRKLSTFMDQGILAFPAFSDGWYLWTGFFSDGNSARSYQENIKSKLGSKYDYSVINPSQNAILVLSNQYSTSSSSYADYKVQKGDTLSKISQKFNMTLSELKSLNNLTSDAIKVEQILKVKGIGLKDSRIALLYDSSSKPLRIHPNKEPDIFELNYQDYRGDLEVKRVSASDMTVINALSLDHYLYGVVPAELGGSSGIPYEAMKTQAVASRTYTVSNMGKYASLGFDVVPTESSQVYKGLIAETSITNKAVDDTSGELLFYDGKVAQVFYSSSNGGSTEEIQNVWNSNAVLPYLKSFEDKFDPCDAWEVTLTADQIKKITNDKIGNILNVVITKTADSHRVTELKIIGDKGELPAYTKESCRTVFSLPSQMFTISTDVSPAITDTSSVGQLDGKKVVTKDGVKRINLKDNLVTVIGKNSVKSVKSTLSSIVPTGGPTPAVYKFTGKGRGHGLGLSQKGALAMAGSGYTYKQILEYYFPGTDIE